MRLAVALAIIALEAVACAALFPGARSDRLHVVRNGSRVCVYTRGTNGRIFPADAGACENLKLNREERPVTKPRTKTKEPDAEASLFAPPPIAEAPAPQLPATTDAKPPSRARVKAAETARVVPITDPGLIMGMIERLATNKDVDPEKLERILALQERLLDRNQKMAFEQAMFEMRPHLPIIAKDGKIEHEGQSVGRGRDYKLKARFAKWETLMPTIDPILHQFGFFLRHRIGTAPDLRVRVTAILTGHGYTDDGCYFDLGADTGGAKSNAQAWASSVSFAKRHTACAVLNIVTRDEDNDGAGKPVVVGQPIDMDQAAGIRDLAEAVGCKVERLVEHLDKNRPKAFKDHPPLAKLDDLPAARFDEAIAALRSYEANAKAAAQGGQR